MTFPVKPPRRTEVIRFYTTQEESKDIVKAASQNGMSVSEFSRVVIMQSIHPTPHMDDIKKETTHEDR